MSRKIIIDLDIEEPGEDKTKTIPVRLEEKLGAAFVKLCKKEYDLPASKVLRIVIREICKEKGYWKG